MSRRPNHDVTAAPTVYVAGPMRGLEHYNFPAFFDAEETLTARGYQVHNPARAEVERGFDTEASLEANGFDLARVMGEDLTAVLSVDYVYVLPGWQASVGARLEVAVAQAAGVPVIDYATGVRVGTLVETAVA